MDELTATISIQGIDEAQAENAASRGPANRFRAMVMGASVLDDEAEPDDPDEGEIHLVVSEAFTALDMMTGNGEPFAWVGTAEHAELVASLLNKHFAA